MEGMIRGKIVSNEDKAHSGMMQVSYQIGAEDQVKSEWLPVLVPFGTDSYVSSHLPAVGSTVMLGHVMGDSSGLMVLGCLWSGDKAVPEKTLTVNAGEKIVVKINNKEMLTIKENNITVKGNLTIKVERDLSLDAGNIALASGQNMTVKGNQTKVEGNLLEMKANASGKMNASGLLELKGSILKLN